MNIKPDEVAEIVSDLLRKTRQKEVPWSEVNAPAGSDVIRLDLTRSSVRLVRNGSELIRFEVLNDRGTAVISIGSIRGQKMFDSLDEMLELALRQIRSVDETLEDVFRFLRRPT